MPTMEDYAKQPRELRLKRLERTADELVAAIRGQSEATLSRRPDARNWAANEVVCHLRDAEELFMVRFETIMASDEPALTALDPEQWKRGGVHPVRGRFTLDDFATLMAWHDDNHLDQLKRALAGKA